ncbi:hypothetical protein IE53DRAFT_374193 [Violaceomyces palustris]|uniref:Uncharacterized protein n=1 Tax=Violaceomyces palustris TaxID=1673888 RepID=A0ACD0NZN2_9BASI|nr:hypothetical protein IE53DRAFT_374193 [Violaceomyces palustris]
MRTIDSGSRAKARRCWAKTATKRDAYTSSTPPSNEGEDHSPPKVPDGAILASLPITGGSQDLKESLAVYWSEEPSNSTARFAYVMIHGRMRDGNDYWTTMNDALTSAVKANYRNAFSSSIVVAPQFYSTRFNSGQYSSNQLGWDDTNTWQAGEKASHPQGTDVTSFDALDTFIDEFTDRSKYPAMEKIVFVGHGGGGQLLNRYAIVGKDAPEGSPVTIRWISGDPSSSPYFTEQRPLNDTSVADKKTCPLYNTWRYGFDNFTGTQQGLKTPQEYFGQASKRDVRYIVGYQDTSSDGDQECMAKLQGGVARRDRNLSWWRYINTLARTNEDLTGFPGSFQGQEALPDWSGLSGGTLNHKLTVVRDADHDAAEVFGSDEGRSVLFDDDGQVALGWRPSGWVQRKSMGSSSSSSSSSTPTSSSERSSSSSTSDGGTSAMARLVTPWMLVLTLLTLAILGSVLGI